MTNNQVETSGKKGTRNVVLLAMSTLPIDKPTGKCKPKESRFTYPEIKDENGYIYYSQLEPISRMIKEQNKSLDHVVILATKETLEKKSIKESFIYCNNPYISESNYDSDNLVDINAVEFYKKRVGISDDMVDIIEINKVDSNNNISMKNGLDIGQAINDAVNKIRMYWADNADSNIKLYVDTQGAFREINLAMNAIISSLEVDEINNDDAQKNTFKIVPQAIYSIEYNDDNNINQIKDQTDTYRVFDFVSGINELRSYGRADQLVNYYEKKGGEQPKVVKCMKDVADSIQMCNVRAFDDNLKKLREAWVEFEIDRLSTPLLSIFLEQIKEDYGKLLTDDDCSIDIIEWMYNKRLYQQALTYIEVFMPPYWHAKSNYEFNIIDIDEQTLQNETKKEKNEKPPKKEKNQSDENFVLLQIGYNKLNKSKTISNTSITKIKEKVNKRIANEKNKKIKGFKGDFVFIAGKSCKKCEWSISETRYESFVRIIHMYQTLKEERNLYNHMIKTKTMADASKLEEFIRTFIVWNRELESEARS